MPAIMSLTIWSVCHVDTDHMVTIMNHMTTNTFDYCSHVAANVDAAIKGAGLSVAATAERTGIPRTTLSRHLHNPETSPFDVMELYRIAKVTRKTVSSLTRYKPEPKPVEQAVQPLAVA